MIYPTVDISALQVSEKDDGYYLIVSGLVPYKRIDLAIEAFNRISEWPVIVGSGPDERRLKALAGKNIEFVGWTTPAELGGYYENCRALIFPGEEDFGITAVEAQACGNPVIACARGGVLETVVGTGNRKTGLFFQEPSRESLLQVLEQFRSEDFQATVLRRNVKQFARAIFTRRIKRFVKRMWSERVEKGR